MPVSNRVQAKVQTQFEIGLTELDVIEEALRYQAQSLAKQAIDGQEQDEAQRAEKYKARMAEIQLVLGSLHNQKAWYVPRKAVPLG